MHSCLIYGVGGHASVVAELAVLNKYRVTAFFDDHKKGEVFREVPVLAYEKSLTPQLPVVIAIGNNQVRKQIAAGLAHPTLTLVHPAAVVAGDVHLGTGTVVLANATVQPAVTIGKHCIVNIGSSIDHDAVIADYVHVGPNVYIGGGVVVEEGVTIGAGAVIMRHTRIKAWTSVPPNSMLTEE